MAQRKRQAPIEDDYGDDEEMREAPPWAKALYRALNNTNGGKRTHERSDDDSDEGDEGETKEKPKPNRKHWLLG